MPADNVTALGRRKRRAAARDSAEQVIAYLLEPRDGGLWRVRMVDDVRKSSRRIANFVPQVVERVETFDAAGDRSVSFVVDVATRERVERVEVAESKLLAFLSVVPGLVSDEGRDKPELRRAIAESAVGKPTTRRYAQLGWIMDLDRRNAFLHGAGAICAGGPAEGMRIHFNDRLANYVLPDPPTRDAAPAVIRAAVDAFLAAGDRHVMLILLAAVVRAPLGAAPTYIVFLSGPTGAGKTSVARLATAWFGPGLAHRDAKTWSFMGTPYALQKALSNASGVAVLVDEYLGTPAHRQTVELLGRSVTGAVRDRLTANLTDRPVYAPNAMILATGETDVDRASLAVRTVSVECTPTMRAPVNAYRDAERAALDGVFAQAMSTYIQRVAYERDRRGVDDIGMPYGWVSDVNACRSEIDAVMLDDGAHPRAVDNIADLLAALARFIDHTVRIGAYTEREARQLVRETMRALLLTFDSAAFDEVTQTVGLLADALAAHRCHLTNRSGTAPKEDAHLLGWTRGSGMYAEDRPCGPCVGYVHGEVIDFLPDALVAVLRDSQRRAGVEPNLTRTRVARLLHGGGFLERSEGRGTYGLRRRIGTTQIPVWPIQYAVIFADPTCEYHHSEHRKKGFVC